RAADVRDETRLAEVQGRQDVPDDVVDAGVLQADRAQHPGRRLPDAMRRIAEARCERRALQHDRADVAVRETLDPRVLFAETDAPGQEHDGRSELQAAKVDRQTI